MRYFEATNNTNSGAACLDHKSASAEDMTPTTVNWQFWMTEESEANVQACVYLLAWWCWKKMHLMQPTAFQYRRFVQSGICPYMIALHSQLAPLSPKTESCYSLSYFISFLSLLPVHSPRPRRSVKTLQNK